MRHEWTEAVVDGYGSGETDFAQRLAASPSLRDKVNVEIMSPLMNAPDGAILVIEGHADAIDSDEGHRTRLLKEVEAARLRMHSAHAEILHMIGRDWLEPSPSRWEDLPNLAVQGTAVGASQLLAGTSEADRLKNRRVYLAVCRFIGDE